MTMMRSCKVARRLLTRCYPHAYRISRVHSRRGPRAASSVAPGNRPTSSFQLSSFGGNSGLIASLVVIETWRSRAFFKSPFLDKTLILLHIYRCASTQPLVLARGGLHGIHGCMLD